MINKKDVVLIIGIVTIFIIVVVFVAIHKTANAHTNQNNNSFLFATKTELHNTASSISKDLQTLKNNQNGLFDALKQVSNDNQFLEYKVTKLEQKQLQLQSNQSLSQQPMKRIPSLPSNQSVN